MKFTKLSTCSFTLLMSACVADGTIDSADDELASVDQDLTGVSPHTVDTTSFTSELVASDAGVACFLSGVTGELGGLHGAGQGGVDTRFQPSRFLGVPGKWFLEAATSHIYPVKAFATCVNATGLTSEVTWTAPQDGTLWHQNIAPVTPNRRCFFTSLQSSYSSNDYYGWGYSGGFTHAYDIVAIKNDGSNWYIEGSSQGSLWARARCMDVTEDLGQFWNFSGTGSGKLTYPMVPNNGSNACFLTQLDGMMVATNDLDAGVHVEQVNGYLNLSVKSSSPNGGTGGRLRCVR